MTKKHKGRRARLTIALLSLTAAKTVDGLGCSSGCGRRQLPRSSSCSFSHHPRWVFSRNQWPRTHGDLSFVLRSSSTLSYLDSLANTNEAVSELVDEEPSSPPNQNRILSDELYRQLRSQPSNLDTAQLYDFDRHDYLQPITKLQKQKKGNIIQQEHVQFYSWDDLFPNLGFSDLFNSCDEFRTDFRRAIRIDMIQCPQNLAYSNLSDEQKNQEIRQEKPAIGEWKIVRQEKSSASSSVAAEETFQEGRMTHTTRVLQTYFGKDDDVPSGDDLMQTLGNLSNSQQAPYHWTEVVGVGATQNTKLGDLTPYGWHQDYGCLESSSGSNNNRHVFVGFPLENHYRGTGVLPHLVKLETQQIVLRQGASWERPMPIFYSTTSDEVELPPEFIVRPIYEPGKAEIMTFRDIDVLHSVSMAYAYNN